MRMPRPEPSEIGRRARVIRRRRGLSLEAAAGLAGISKGYLSMLERGQRGFERRGLLEDVAHALGCAVADLTGQPYQPGDRAGAQALAALAPISVAFYDATLDDVPDRPARPLERLAPLAAAANEQVAHSLYASAGQGLADLITELHVHIVTGQGDTALAALVEACLSASAIARSLGNADLAVIAAGRAQEAARRLEATAVVGFAAMACTSALSRLGARHRAGEVAEHNLALLESVADPTARDVSAAEAAGMLHLSSAQMAAKDHRTDDAAEHLRHAADLANQTGERNTLWFSFGPANVLAWSLSIAVESGEGITLAERIEKIPGYAEQLPTADRRGALHFDLARAYSQAGNGTHDASAVRHLDLADRIAPQRIRHDPVARELVHGLDRRARIRVWELESLKNRLGVY